MRIGIDVDGVLAARIPAILALIERRHGVSIAREEVTDWSVSVPTTDRDISSYFAETDADPEHIRALDPIDGAVEGMRRLARHHTLLIATYRKPEAAEPTMEWLDSNGIPYDRYVRDVGERKRNVRATVLVDDSPRTVRAFVESGREAILFRQPWNRQEQIPDGIPVADGWADVLEELGL